MSHLSEPHKAFYDFYATERQPTLGAMKTQAEIRVWLKRSMSDVGMGAADLAERSGVHKSTVFRILSEDYEFTPSNRTLDKLSKALASARVEMGGEGSLDEMESLLKMPIYSDLGRGIWIEKSESRVQPPGPFTYISSIGIQSQISFRIADDSSGEGYEVGDYVHVLIRPSLTRDMMFPGNHLVVRRIHRDVEIAEATLWELLTRDDDQVVTVQSRTPDRSGTRIVIRLATGEEVEDGPYKLGIYGLVIAQFRPRHAFSLG